MAIILNIDTSGNKGLVAIAKDGICLHKLYNYEAMQHAAFIQPAIQILLKETGIAATEIKAVAVSNGPGSYTGLRVGLASAKGLCFAWDVPLIALNSLKIMAYAVCQNMTTDIAAENIICRTNNDSDEKLDVSNKENSLPVLYCPMIDARRMEVFFALYNEAMEEVIPAGTAIITEQFLANYLSDHQIIFFGSGADKWQSINRNVNSIYVTEPFLDKSLCSMSEAAYAMSGFDIPDAVEPFYAKEFYSTHPANGA